MEYNFIWNPNETYKDFFETLDDRKEAINDAAMMEDSYSNRGNAMNREAWARVERLWKEEVLRLEFPQLTAVTISQDADTSFDFLPSSIKDRLCVVYPARCKRCSQPLKHGDVCARC